MKKIFLVVITIGIFTSLSFLSAGTVSAELAYEPAYDNCETGTNIISCDSRLDSKDEPKEGIEGTGLWSILLLVLNILTGGVGVLALAGVVYGSVMYTSSAGNPEQTKKAIGIIQNVVIGILAYAVMYSLLQWIVPGGVFN